MLSTNAANEYKYTQYKNTQPFFNNIQVNLCWAGTPS